MKGPWFVVQRRIGGEVEAFHFKVVRAPDAASASARYASAPGNGTAAGPFYNHEEAAYKRNGLGVAEVDRLR